MTRADGVPSGAVGPERRARGIGDLDRRVPETARRTTIRPGGTAAAWAGIRSRAAKRCGSCCWPAGGEPAPSCWPRASTRPPIVEHIVELAREQRATVREVSRSELDATARTEAPQGVVALADPLPESELVDLVEAPQRVAAWADPLPEVELAELVESPQGVVARADPQPEVEVAEAPRQGAVGRDGRSAGVPFLLVLDGITDPRQLRRRAAHRRVRRGDRVVLPRHRSARITPTVAKARRPARWSISGSRLCPASRQRCAR